MASEVVRGDPIMLEDFMAYSFGPPLGAGRQYGLLTD